MKDRGYDAGNVVDVSIVQSMRLLYCTDRLPVSTAQCRRAS